MDSEESEYQNENSKPCFAFDEVLCNGNILNNPMSNEVKIADQIFNKKAVDKIKIGSCHIEIMFALKLEEIKQFKTNSQASTNSFQESKNSQIKFPKINEELFEKFVIFKDKVLSTNFNSSLEFVKWLKRMEGKNYVAWHLPLTKTGPRLRSLVISKKTLIMMGFGFEESMFDFLKYQSYAFDILSNQAYKQMHEIYLSTFTKFAQQNSLEANIVLQNQPSVYNELITKNQVKQALSKRTLKVEMKVYMPSPFIICNEIVRIIRKQNRRDDRMESKKKSIVELIEEKAVLSLEHVVRLASKSQEKHEKNRCSYKQIKRQQSFK